ncbi:OTOR, partial [Cervus elaphus hippelaphus]
TISLARAQEDYNAPDCRFINVKKGQRIYVYSKLVKENEAGEFWAGSEQHVYQEATKEVPTTDIDFFCE